MNTEQVSENNYTKEQKRIWKKVNSPKRIKQQLDNRIIFCVLQNNKLVGTIGLKGNEIVGLYVSYSQRKLGIGRKLLRHLEDYAKSQKLKILTLTSTPSALKFYETNGYQAIESVIINIMDVPFRETAMKKDI